MDEKTKEMTKDPKVVEQIQLAAKEAAKLSRQLERRLRPKPEDMTHRVSI